MRLPVTLILDTDADSLLVQVAAAEGEGDVTVLTLDLKPLAAGDKRKLRHIRPPEQAQPAPGGQSVSRR